MIHFGEALHEELRGTGFGCVPVSGFTETEFAQVAGLPDAVVVQHGIGAAAVVETGLASCAASADRRARPAHAAAVCSAASAPGPGFARRRQLDAARVQAGRSLIGCFA